MKTHPGSPSSNQLGAGITEADLDTAVRRSGYPLQSQVVDALLAAVSRDEFRPEFQEEWGWFDKDEQQIRQLDALLSFEVLEEREDAGRRSSPMAYLRKSLDLLIECKQSELPFVFFVRDRAGCRAPQLAGLPHPELSLAFEPNSEPRIGMSAYDALGLRDLPFGQADRMAVSLARTERDGKKVKISGEESFRGLALPLLKAAEHFESLVAAKPHHLYFDVRAVFPVAVLRAPMIAVSVESGEPEFEAVPWVRVVRTEPADDIRMLRMGSNVRFFDVVHVDALDYYCSRLREGVLSMASRVNRFAIPLLTGEACWQPRERDEHPAAPPCDGMEPLMDEAAFAAWIDRRWTEAHAPKGNVRISVVDEEN